MDSSGTRMVRWRLLMALLLMLPAMTAWSAAGKILVVGDVSRPYVRSFVLALEQGTARSGDTLRVVSRIDQSPANGSYRAIVTVGHDAAQQVAAMDLSVPVLYAMVTAGYADELRSRVRAPQSAYLLVEQPVARLLSLAMTALPKRTRIGVLYGPTSQNYNDEVRRLARSAEVTLVERSVASEAELGAAVAYFKGNADLLLVLPDPAVVNEGTAKTLILGSYLGNLPLVGYSQALVKAGALMSVYSTPEMLGKQSAELLSGNFWSDSSLAGAKLYPTSYEVSVNYQVAYSLSIDLPDERELQQRIKRAERAR